MGELAWVLCFFHFVKLSSQVIIDINKVLGGVVFPNLATVVLISVWL